MFVRGARAIRRRFVDLRSVPERTIKKKQTQLGPWLIYIYSEIAIAGSETVWFPFDGLARADSSTQCMCEAFQIINRFAMRVACAPSLKVYT